MNILAWVPHVLHLETWKWYGANKYVTAACLLAVSSSLLHFLFFLYFLSLEKQFLRVFFPEHSLNAQSGWRAASIFLLKKEEGR